MIVQVSIQIDFNVQIQFRINQINCSHVLRRQFRRGAASGCREQEKPAAGTPAVAGPGSGSRCRGGSVQNRGPRPAGWPCGRQGVVGRDRLVLAPALGRQAGAVDLEVVDEELLDQVGAPLREGLVVVRRRRSNRCSRRSSPGGPYRRRSARRPWRASRARSARSVSLLTVEQAAPGTVSATPRWSTLAPRSTSRPCTCRRISSGRSARQPGQRLVRRGASAAFADLIRSRSASPRRPRPRSVAATSIGRAAPRRARGRGAAAGGRPRARRLGAAGAARLAAPAAAPARCAGRRARPRPARRRRARRSARLIRSSTASRFWRAASAAEPAAARSCADLLLELAACSRATRSASVWVEPSAVRSRVGLGCSSATRALRPIALVLRLAELARAARPAARRGGVLLASALCTARLQLGEPRLGRRARAGRDLEPLLGAGELAAQARDLGRRLARPTRSASRPWSASVLLRLARLELDLLARGLGAGEAGVELGVLPAHRHQLLLDPLRPRRRHPRPPWSARRCGASAPWLARCSSSRLARSAVGSAVRRSFSCLTASSSCRAWPASTATAAALDSSSSRARAAASASLSSANGARSSPAAGARRPPGPGCGVVDQDHRRRRPRPPAASGSAAASVAYNPAREAPSSAQIGKPLATWSRLLSIDHDSLSTLLGQLS